MLLCSNSYTILLKTNELNFLQSWDVLFGKVLDRSKDSRDTKLKTVLTSEQLNLLWQKSLHVHSFSLLTLPGQLSPVHESLTHKSRVLLLLDNQSRTFVLFTYCAARKNTTSYQTCARQNYNFPAFYSGPSLSPPTLSKSTGESLGNKV